MKPEAVNELSRIAARTADSAGHLRQFEMRDSRSFQGQDLSETIHEMQTHIGAIYGMIQRICFLLIEEEQ